MNTKHTPTPWEARGTQAGTHIVGGNPLTLIAAFDHNEAHAQNEANAAHIVRCVNERDALIARQAELVAALREALSALEEYNRADGRSSSHGTLMAATRVVSAALAKVAP